MIISAAALVLAATTNGLALADDPNDTIKEAAILQGYAASPVPKDQLNLTGKNPYLVGLGSYLVNGVGDCAGCHTLPRFLSVGRPGSNPAAGDPFEDSGSDQSLTGQVKANHNITHFLAGGRCFGAIMARNITPDPAHGNLPAGLTEEEFIQMMR